MGHRLSRPLSLAGGQGDCDYTKYPLHEKTAGSVALPFWRQKLIAWAS